MPLAGDRRPAHHLIFMFPAPRRHVGRRHPEGTSTPSKPWELRLSVAEGARSVRRLEASTSP